MTLSRCKITQLKIIRFVYSIHTHSPLDKLGYIAGAEEKEGGGEVDSGAAGSGGAHRPRTYIRSASTVQKKMIKQKRLHLGNK